MSTQLLALAAGLSIAYYLPSVAARLKVSRAPEKHPASKALMYAVYALFYVLSAAYFFASPEPQAAWLSFAGALTASAGVLLHYYSVKALGDSYSAGTKLKKNPVLVTSGVYALARHPLYSASAVFFLGLALLLSSPASALAYALVLIYLAYRIREEEKILRDEFGESYEAYSKRVPATVIGWLAKGVQ